VLAHRAKVRIRNTTGRGLSKNRIPEKGRPRVASECNAAQHCDTATQHDPLHPDATRRATAQPPHERRTRLRAANPPERDRSRGAMRRGRLRDTLRDTLQDTLQRGTLRCAARCVTRCRTRGVARCATRCAARGSGAFAALQEPEKVDRGSQVAGDMRLADVWMDDVRADI
jgi:hypothetical protein